MHLVSGYLVCCKLCMEGYEYPGIWLRHVGYAQKTNLPNSREDTVGKVQRNFKAFKRKQDNAQASPKVLKVFKMNEAAPAIDATAFLK